MADDDVFVELAQQCVKVCYVLKTVAVGRDWDDMTESTQMLIESLEKYVHLIA